MSANPPIVSTSVPSRSNMTTRGLMLPACATEQPLVRRELAHLHRMIVVGRQGTYIMMVIPVLDSIEDQSAVAIHEHARAGVEVTVPRAPRVRAAAGHLAGLHILKRGCIG